MAWGFIAGIAFTCALWLVLDRMGIHERDTVDYTIKLGPCIPKKEKSYGARA